MAGPFWQEKSLAAMTREEWESLCDGCGKCCLVKLEDEDSGELHYTRAVCRYMDQQRCHCKVYDQRQRYVPTCVVLEPGNLEDVHFMPSTCAYRLLYEGRALPAWHPLLTGDRQAMIDSGNCVSGKVISEEYVHEDGLEEHIVRWVD